MAATDESLLASAAMTPLDVRVGSAPRAAGRRLQQLGVVLFLLGLLTGLTVPALGNPRMGLASHLEALMNGTFLVVLGLLWPHLRLGARPRAVAFGLAIYGAFANWLATLLAAVWRAGNSMMPMAAQGGVGTPGQEAAIKALLVSLSLAMIASSALVAYGLRGSAGPSESADGGRA